MNDTVFHKSLWQRICFRLRFRFNIFSEIRRVYWSLQGAQLSHKTTIPKMLITWPHQVAIGKNCLLEADIFFKFDGIWQSGPSIIIKDSVFIGRGCEFNIRQGIEVGSDCLIASGCKFVDHDHGAKIGQSINSQEGDEAAIILEEDVWLGVNAVVLKGVTLGKGSIIGAGAVVTKSIPPYEIWAGIPARKIGERE